MLNYSPKPFPEDEYQALAYLYTQNQNLQNKSVQEIAEIYYNAYWEFAYKTRDFNLEAMNRFKNNS